MSTLGHKWHLHCTREYHLLRTYPWEHGPAYVALQITAPEVDPLVKVRIGHDDSGMGSAWHLDYVEITNKGTGKRFMFPCNKWFSKSKDDFQIERDLFEAGTVVSLQDRQ